MRSLSPEEAKRLPDVSHGLENRLINEAMNACSLEELFFAVKTKRYPMAKIRRIIMSALLGIEKSDTEVLPPYGRILAFNDRGCEILRAAQSTAKFPIDTSLASLRRRAEHISVSQKTRLAQVIYMPLHMGKFTPAGLTTHEKSQKFKDRKEREI